MDVDALQEGVIRGAAGALAPFVDRLLDLRVPYGHLERRLRELFVDRAESRTGPQTLTDSGIAVLTGINRKEVRRIRGRSGPIEEPKTFGRSVATNLLREWASDAATSDPDGGPLPLPFRSRKGPSFVGLCRRITRELRPKTVLEELLRTGAVVRRDDGTLLPVSESFVPRSATPEGFDLLAEDPAELAGTMLRNLLDGGDEPFFQRRVYFDNVGTDSLERIRRDTRREGERIVTRMTRRLSQYDRDVNPAAPRGGRRYVSFGLYFFESDDPRKTGTASVPSRRGGRAGKRKQR